MASVKTHNYDILKALFPPSDPTWDTRVSLASKENWDVNKVLIASQNFQPLRNQVYDALINRIALTKVNSISFNNRLAMLKRGEMLFGDTVQEIAVDVIKAQTFDPMNDNDQFKRAHNDVKAAYHRINREQYYQVTHDDPRMKRAFMDDFGLQALLAEIMKQMGGSNEIDELVFVKKLFSSFYDNQESPLLHSQVIVVPDLEASQDKPSIDKFIMQVKLIMRKMMFPNRLFNATGLMSQTDPSEMMCFLKNDYTVINEVYNLSSAFRPEFLDLEIPIIGIDDFGDDRIVGIICDKEAFNIYDTLSTVTTSDNALALYKNYYYHKHQIYYGSPFKNVIYLVKGN